MKKTLSVAILILCNTVFAQIENIGYSELDEYIKGLQVQTKSQSISAAIYMDDDLLWANGYEMFNDEAKGIQPNGSYRIGSVSKLFTATILEIMRSEGRLNLDDPVFKYIPEFGDKGRKMTLMSLANHTSGVRHYNYKEDKSIREHYETSRSGLELFINDSLLFEPGENYNYSSYGYNLIAACLEKITATSYQELLKEYITLPFGLNSIEVENNGNLKSSYVDLYQSNEKIVEPKDLSYKWPSGGLRANAMDLVKFASLFFNNSDFFDKNSKADFSTAMTLENGGTVPHAVGWKVDSLNIGKKVMYHDGEVQGGHAHLMVIPELNISIAILVNRGSYFSLDEGLFLAKKALGLETEVFGIQFKKDEAKISKTVKSMQNALRDFRKGIHDGDLELLSTCISNNFSSVEWKNKVSFMDFLASKVGKGDAIVEKDTKIDVSIGGIENGALTIVSNLKYESLFDRDYSFIFKLFDGKWTLHSVSLES
ncbi:MAG: serine hydrolase domain-containing protein [Flagellimonas sp.]